MRKKFVSRYQTESKERTPKKELLVNSLKLPKDTVLGAPILTVTGNREIWMENYKGILEYTTTQILLQAKKMHHEVYSFKVHLFIEVFSLLTSLFLLQAFSRYIQKFQDFLRW